MFEVGQKVKVTNREPPAEGVIVDVSTERMVFQNNYGSDETCYLVQSPDWKNEERWIVATFVELA